MKPSKSVNSLLTNGNHHLQQQQTQMVSNNLRRPQPPEPQRMAQQQQQSNGTATPTSPICRCRVMYLGSSVPHITKDGLQGIQEPLRELYPDESNLASGNAGIDSWLSVWSNGILIENVDENGREIKRFFKIEALHYCAAVKYIPQQQQQQQQQQQMNGSTTINDNMPKFLPLDSPHARMQRTNSNPPIFASILRRTTGVKVLECHAFICKREAAANALVRCCFHAYADTMYAKQIGADIDHVTNNNPENRPPTTIARRSKSTAALNADDSNAESSGDTNRLNNNNNNNTNGDHYQNSVMRRKSMNENGVEISDHNQTNLRKQYQLSKSMHQLDRADQQLSNTHHDYASQMGSHSASIHNLATSKARWNQAMEQEEQQQQPSFYNPYSSRIPSYPPQNLIDQQQQQQRQLNNGGTLRSIKSMTANSIASTLLRSKKHAKAMSAAQMATQQELGRLPGFHQPHLNGSATLAPNQSFMMPPVPAMFLPRLPIVNGSQTMKLPRHYQQPMLAPYPPINFETMTPKEIKRLLKKSAKYGLDPSKFGSPESIGPPPPMMPFAALQQPPMPFPPAPPSLHSNKSGTLNSQSIYSMEQQLHGVGQDMSDYAAGLPPAPSNFCHQGPPIKSILVKPNPEFLKSKPGKKWLKQQKEFKKLLPPHLDGLPIVFGPPPMDALEPASPMNDSNGAGIMPPPQAFLQPAQHPGMPLMDTNGYYSQTAQPMYLLPSGRASTASTLLRYSPQSNMMMMQPPPPPPPPPPMRDNSIMMNGCDDSTRQYVFTNGDTNTNHRRRRHMVEQSVISLGDENEGEDDDNDNQDRVSNYNNGNNINLAEDVDDDEGQMNGYYNRVSDQSSSTRQHYRDDQQNYEQVIPPDQHQQQPQPQDDQGSYSSGIYRRGHLNERAFSYSIRQEHKVNYNNQQPVGMYDNPQHQIMYHAENGNSNMSRQMDDLSARLENQLEMRSFVNSARVRSHM